MNANRRPNVLLIIMDDLCWGDLACHGNPFIRTPNLDALHGESVCFTRHCSGPLCSPARASLMTGRYHLRTRVIDTYCGRSMLDPGEVTLAQVLADAGYRTGAFGKWHLGDCYPMRAMDLGFQETLMHLGGGIGQYGDHVDNRERESYFDPVLHRNGRPENSTGYCTDLFADAALEFIEQHRDEPFFAYLATNAPHTPLLVSDEWANPYRAAGLNDTHARLYGMVENIDWNVGRLLARLDELGLTEDTIVIYTSDHGPCRSARDRTAPPDRQVRFNAGLRGEKGTVYEGGIRVPCFWRWPNRFSAGRDVDRVTHPIDVVPTLSDLCGAPLPTEHHIDGMSLEPLLRDEVPAEAWPDRPVFMQWHRGDQPVRFRNYAVITQRFKLTRPCETAPDELYDLHHTPDESIDVAPKQADLVAHLRDEYEGWFDDVSSTRPDNYAPPLIHIGATHAPETVLSRQDWRVHGPDGWDENHYGHWEVLVEDSGPYTVHVRFREPPQRLGSVHFQVNGEHSLQPADLKQHLYMFEGISFPQGPARIEAWLDSPEAFSPALYVEIRQALD